MKTRDAAALSLHVTAQAVALAVCGLTLAAFVLQNPYQIPGFALKLAGVILVGLLGFRFPKPALAAFFPLIAVSGFVHLILRIESTGLDAAACALYLGWATGKALGGALAQKDMPSALAYSHGLILVLGVSMAALLTRYPASFLLYRTLYTEPQGLLDPRYSIRAGSTLVAALCLFEMGLREGRFSDKGLYRLLAVQGGLIGLFAAIQLFFQYPQLRLPGLFSPFADIHSFAGYALLLFAFFLALGFDKPSPWVKRALPLCFAGMFLAAIALSNSRSTWLLAVLSLAVIGLSRLERRKALALTVAGIAGLVLSGAIFLAATKDYGDTLGTSMRRNVVVRVRNLISLPLELFERKQSGEVQTLRGRFGLWEQALVLAARHPLTGVGVGEFYRESAPSLSGASPDGQTPVRQNAHNWYLQILAELGLPGLVLVLGLFGTVVKSAIAAPGLSPKRRALLVGLFVYGASCLTGHHLILNAQQYAVLFLLACLGQAGQPGQAQRGSAPALAALSLAVIAAVALLAAPQAGQARTESYGLYAPEPSDGLSRRWTMREFCLPVRVESGVMVLEMRGVAQNVPGGRQTLELSLDSMPLDRVVLDSPATRRFAYHIETIAGQTALLCGKLDASFNPAARGAGADNRDLGVLLSEPRFFPR